MATITTTTKRVNFNVEETKYENWQSWSAASGFTITELLTTAMALLGEAYKAQATGGQLILATKDGLSKAIVLPTKTIVMLDNPGAAFSTASVPAESTSEKVGPVTA
jgi:hypothetical protein